MLLSRAHGGSLNHTSTVTWRSLSELAGYWQASIQEAVYQIAGLNLVICSDYPTGVSIGRARCLQKNISSSTQEKDLTSSYRNCPQSHGHMSLEKCFYGIFSKTKFYAGLIAKREKHLILVPKGLNCRPRYPVDCDCAEGMLAVHRPRSARNPLTDLLNSEEAAAKTFLQMIESSEMPHCAVSEFHRAVQYSQQWQCECVLKRVAANNEANLAELDNGELADLIHWEHS